MALRHKELRNVSCLVKKNGELRAPNTVQSDQRDSAHRSEHLVFAFNTKNCPT